MQHFRRFGYVPYGLRELQRYEFSEDAILDPESTLLKENPNGFLH